MTQETARPADASGVYRLGGDLPVNRLGYGAMQLTGPGVWGDPKDPEEAMRVLRRAVELGVNFIDTADSYGPFVSEQLIRKALLSSKAAARRVIFRDRALKQAEAVQHGVE